MSHSPVDIAAYLETIPEDRKKAFEKLRQTIIDHIPEGFEETISYGMIGYVVPLDKYPKGYHVDPKLPLPFVNLANQKNYIALYHLGLYANEALLNWFREEYPKYSSRKLDMGKSCIRFRQVDKIPYELIGQLMEKITMEEWVKSYETGQKK
ncbi:MAG: DUF1801 domain-containing protein [Cyclobacterium sp.]|uniref:DUF1801 domain-containing protein n=1 Tax=unclassified Cyclobacterium TaxID=2615055 RepID=UPI0013D842DF|nr:DUF1801 domain-containing protein [Cyclobacterium sp. SYSU L10401]